MQLCCQQWKHPHPVSAPRDHIQVLTACLTESPTAPTDNSFKILPLVPMNKCKILWKFQTLTQKVTRIKRPSVWWGDEDKQLGVMEIPQQCPKVVELQALLLRECVVLSTSIQQRGTMWTIHCPPGWSFFQLKFPLWGHHFSKEAATLETVIDWLCSLFLLQVVPPRF